MKLLVTCERRYQRSPDGKIWTSSIDDAQFWMRYLAVYEEVLILSRVEDCTEALKTWRVVEADNISVLPFPTGAKNFIKNYFRIRQNIKEILAESYALIIRGPGTLALYFYVVFAFLAHPFALEMTGDPHQMFAKGSYEHRLSPLFQFIFGNFTRHLARSADVVAYVTQRTLQAKYPANSHAFTTSYSSISLDDSAFQRKEKAAKINRISLVSVGSVEKLYKGFAELLEAVARLNNKSIQLKIIGGGAALDELKTLAKRLQVTVEFTGELAGAELVREELQSADCFILASKSEGLPRVLIEAMALGLPCLASNVGGIPELLSAEYLFNPNDIEGIATAIQKMLDKREEWPSIGESNQKKAWEYHEDILSLRRQDMYQELLRRTEKHLQNR